MSDIKIDTSAKTVENESSKKQKADLEKAKQAKEAAAAKAVEESRKAALAHAEAELRKKEEEAAAAKEQAEKKASSASLASGGAALVGALIDAASDEIKSSGSSKKKKKSSGKSRFWLGAVIGLIAGALLMLLIGRLSGGMIFGTNHTSVTTADEVLQTGMLGYTAVDFQNAVLGEASQHQELIVMEQPLEIATTITKAGIGNLQIFSKVKTITYYGTGVYTVDMSVLDKDHVTVDLEKKQVFVKIPHACLQYVNPDLNKTEFEDTEKGLLAFGDIKLKTEDQNRLLQAVYKSMRERLSEPDLFETADEYAKMSAWQIFQPLITAVSPEFTVEVGFDESTSNQVKAVQE